MLNSNTPKPGYWHSQCQHQHFCFIEISGLWSTPFSPNLCIQQYLLSLCMCQRLLGKAGEALFQWEEVSVTYCFAMNL